MTLTQRPVRIFLVGSEFFGTAGGIQRVNCMLLQMLADFSITTPTEVEIFSFADQAGARPSALAPLPRCRWHAFGRSRRVMAASVAWRLMRAEPDLVLFTHANLIRLARLVRALRPKAKVAVLGHGIEVWKTLPSPIRQFMLKADAVIAPSVFTRNKIVEMNGVYPSRVSVLPHGLDASWKVVERAVGSRTGDCLLSVTRLGLADTYKGIELVLRAMPAVLTLHPKATYRIAGDGNDRARLQKLASDLGIENQVEFCGEVTGAKLHALYSQADLFVLPSQKEGFGIVFLEAMSYSLPVVAARSAATPELVRDGITGMLVAPDQPDTLAETLNSLLSDESRRSALGDAARQRVQKSFQFEHFSQRWQRWLVEVLPEPVYLARQTAAFAPLDSPVPEFEGSAA